MKKWKKKNTKRFAKNKLKPITSKIIWTMCFSFSIVYLVRRSRAWTYGQISIVVIIILLLSIWIIDDDTYKYFHVNVLGKKILAQTQNMTLFFKTIFWNYKQSIPYATFHNYLFIIAGYTPSHCPPSFPGLPRPPGCWKCDQWRAGNLKIWL